MMLVTRLVPKLVLPSVTVLIDLGEGGKQNTIIAREIESRGIECDKEGGEIGK